MAFGISISLHTTSLRWFAPERTAKPATWECPSFDNPAHRAKLPAMTTASAIFAWYYFTQPHQLTEKRARAS
jgi:hypothetical protein